MDPHTSPFAVLSLIVAPAILTNAASVLAMSTSNRLARAVDRARDLGRQLEDTSTPDPSPDEGARESARRLRGTGGTEARAGSFCASCRVLCRARRILGRRAHVAAGRGSLPVSNRLRVGGCR